MQKLKRLLFFGLLLSFSNPTIGQEQFSTAWYFEHFQPFAYSDSPVGFSSPSEAWVFDGKPAVFFKITSGEELDEVKNYHHPERVRGIFLDNSLVEFDKIDLQSTLKSLPNLQFLQFSGTSFFQPRPNQLIPFPDFIRELSSVSIFSFLGPLEFTEESLVEVFNSHEKIEGLFFYGESKKIPEKLISNPRLKALRCGTGSLPTADFTNAIEYLELQGTDKSGFTDDVLHRAKEFPKITHLSISYGRIKPDFDFKGFEKLRFLNLSNLDSTHDIQIFEKITALKNLEKLKIWNLTQSAQDFSALGQLTSLSSLYLGRVKVQKNSSPLESINNLTNLEDLTLTEMKADFQNHDLSNLTKLKNLVLTSDSIHALPPKLFEKKPLERIILSYNQLTTLEGIESCSQLQNLQIQANQFESLSFLDKGFPNLRVLDASKNQIRDIPEDFSKLKSLSSLNLGLNQITVFPLEISALTKIDTIHLNGNPIAAFRGKMVENKSLRELIFVGTLFKTLPDEFTNFKNLSYLMLSHGQLNEFPAGFRNLKNLKLSSQKPDSSVVFRLPEDLYLNTNLENLELGFTSQFSQNSLFEFLSNFEPTKPFSLNLVDMGITELPEGDFWQKIKWGSIELTSNQLNKLPASWKNLKNFDRIQLFGNPLMPGNNKRLFLTSYNQLAVLLYLQGQEIDLGEIPRTDILAGISHLITKYRSEVQDDIIIQLAELGELYKGDSLELMSGADAIGLALFNKGEFSRAIPFLESHLQQFVSQRMRVLNLIYETLEGLEISYANQKEFQKLIDLHLLKGKELGMNSGYFYAGLLSKKYNLNDQSETYFHQGLAVNQNRLETLISRNQQELGFILDYLESSLISGEQETFDSISKIAENWTRPDENYHTIFQMLLALDLQKKGISLAENDAKVISGWNFSLLDLWIDMEPESAMLKAILDNYRISKD
ncbi:MAG: protein phosphatase 1 regulatory subunit 42 [Algoriphagus sp.]|nr:protein phosphatase 1 regulatory subunit 42 [Algoriphagus sp.]